MTDNELLESICPKPLINIADRMLVELQTLDPQNLKYYLISQLVTAYELKTQGEIEFYTISYVHKVAHEWGHIDGLSQKAVNCGYNFHQNSTSLEVLIGKICDHIGTTDYELDDNYPNTLIFTTIEDDNLNLLTLEQQKLWHKEGLRMYMCDYSVSIKCSKSVNIKQIKEKSV